MPRITPLKIAIVNSGVPSRELAARIGKPETDLSRWANGHRLPPLPVAQALSRELGRPIDDLFPLEAPQPQERAA